MCSRAASLSTCTTAASSACGSTHGPSRSRAFRSCSPKMCPPPAAASLPFPPTVRWSTRESRRRRRAHWSGWTVKGERIRLPPRLPATSILACHRDGTRLAVSSLADIWIWTFAKQALTRLTFTEGAEYNPVWMPDGRRVIFDASEVGGRRILSKAADGTGTTDVVMPAPGGYPDAVSPDGKFLVYHTAGQLPTAMLMSLDRNGPARPLVSTKTPTQTFNAEISPDGHWIAYQSDESGRFEIYVHPFPALEAGRWQISFTGGSHPALVT